MNSADKIVALEELQRMLSEIGDVARNNYIESVRGIYVYIAKTPLARSAIKHLSDRPHPPILLKRFMANMKISRPEYNIRANEAAQVIDQLVKLEAVYLQGSERRDSTMYELSDVGVDAWSIYTKLMERVAKDVGEQRAEELMAQTSL